MFTIKFKRILFLSSIVTLAFCELGMAVTLDEQIGQMLIVGFRGVDIENSPKIVNDINNKRIGGVILYDVDYQTVEAVAKKNKISTQEARKKNIIAKNQQVRFERNIRNPKQLAKLTSDLQALSKQKINIPLLIALDREGGFVNKLAVDLGFPETITQFDLAKKDEREIRNITKGYAKTLQENGINYVLAPVIDLAINPDNTAIVKHKRAFSDDPKVVTKLAKIIIDVYSKAQIICAIKHFPGHGSSTKDTHDGLSDVTDTWQTKEIEPYRNLLMNQDHIGLTVMSSHIVNKNLDKKRLPASLSKKTLNILRDSIHYQGIIISDDLQMKAITKHYNLEKTLKLSILAGNDLLIFANQFQYDPNIAKKVIRTVKKLIKEKKISKDRIKQSYDKIVKLKQWVNIKKLNLAG